MGRVGESILDAFEISNRAARVLDYQVDKIAREHLMIGTRKSEYVKQQCAAAGIAKPTAHDRGQSSMLHSWAEYHKFKSALTSIAHFGNVEFGIHRVTDISPQIVSAFLNIVADMGYSRNSVNGYITQIEKFAAFFKMPLHEKSIVLFKESDAYKKLEQKDTGGRAYAQPERAIEALGNIGSHPNVVEKMQFSARLALNYGLRINDACHFKPIPDNKIIYNSKNGMKTEKVLSHADYAKAKALSEHGKYNLSVHTMKAAWGKACIKSGEINTGFHGLRYNYCQNLYNELRSRGLTHKETCLVCSKEMNHSRPEITERYLR